MWARIEDMVDVKARVDQESGAVDIIEEIAGVGAGGVWIGEDREGARGWREGQVLFEVGGVSAFVGTVVDGLGEGVVEVEDVRPVVHVGDNDDLLLYGRITENGVIDSDTCQVVVGLVVGIDESVRNVWDIVSTVGFTSQIHLAVLDLEGFDEVLVEADEL